MMSLSPTQSSTMASLPTSNVSDQKIPPMIEEKRPYATAGYEYQHQSIHNHPTAAAPRSRLGFSFLSSSSLLRRLCTTFAFAVVVWVLISALIQSMMLISHYGTLLASVNDWPSDEDFPIPPDLLRVRCVWGDESGDQTHLRASFKKILRAPLTFPFKVQEKFDLPIEADQFFFLSRGVYSGGRIKIKRSEEVDDVEVKVKLEYLRPGSPKIAKVCQFVRDDGAVGLGVFTPEIPKYPHHNLAYYITVKLPKSSSSSDYLHIKKFETDMPNFTHLLGNLGKSIVFDDISLKSANGAILVDSLVAEQGTFETSNGPVNLHHGRFGSFDVLSRNGPIHGVFNATGSLVLKTINGRITGKVYLNTGDDEFAKLELETTNSYIDTEISLKNSEGGEPGEGGDFDIVASSSFGPIKLGFADAPVDSKLSLNVKNKNAPVNVLLHPTFEGEFHVASVHLPPSVLARGRVSDPKGEGRERHVDLTRQGWRVHGNVSWSEDGEGRGWVNLETSNAPAILRL